MLRNFFRLNDSTKKIESQEDFENLLSISNDLKNLMYMPNDLKAPIKYPRLKINDKIFTNVSFSKTVFSNVTLINCKFEDCLFIGTKFQNCELHNCQFKNVNTHKIEIIDSYINPQSFVNCIVETDKANIAIHLFQQLVHNSQVQGQAKFTRDAKYHFNLWSDRVVWNKFWYKKPYKIGIGEFIKEYPISLLFRWSFGYGLRLRNFTLTFILVFITFFFVNQSKWKQYSLASKDIKIDMFQKDSSNVYSNLLYTFDATTKLVDSQIQAKSDSGILWLSIQSVIGFVLLTALLTTIINRFVK